MQKILLSLIGNGIKFAFVAALECFERMLKRNPVDKAAQIHRDHNIQYYAQGVADGWLVIENMMTE